jgi:hypothetical protein
MGSSDDGIHQRSNPFHGNGDPIARLHGGHSGRGAGKHQVPWKEGHGRGDIAQQVIDGKNKVARVALLAQFPIEPGRDADTRGRVYLIRNQRSNRTESVKTLGAGPLAIFLLQVSSSHVVSDGVTANIVARILIGTYSAASFADDDCNLTFEINALREFGDADPRARR